MAHLHRQRNRCHILVPLAERIESFGDIAIRAPNAETKRARHCTSARAVPLDAVPARRNGADAALYTALVEAATVGCMSLHRHATRAWQAGAPSSAYCAVLRLLCVQRSFEGRLQAAPHSEVARDEHRTRQPLRRVVERLAGRRSGNVQVGQVAASEGAARHATHVAAAHRQSEQKRTRRGVEATHATAAPASAHNATQRNSTHAGVRCEAELHGVAQSV